jgi:hypothetical protein
MLRVARHGAAMWLCAGLMLAGLLGGSVNAPAGAP